MPAFILAIILSVALAFGADWLLNDSDYAPGGQAQSESVRLD